jgi:predicted ATPase
VEFSAAAVAAGVDLTEEDVESRCAALARQGQFLLANGIAEWPDETVAAQFSFIHHLYQEVLYDRVPAGRQVRLHRQIGKRLETGYSSQAPEMAAELAMHFGRGRQPGQAVEYLRLAAEHAVQRNAPREAIEHLKQGLEILRRHPDIPGRVEHELTLQAALGPALIATRGWSVPEAEAAYVRACELAQQVGDAQHLSPVLYGLATLHEMRGEYTQSQTLLEERLQLPQDPQDQGSLLESHELLACSTFHQGAFIRALDHADQGTSLYDARQHLELIAFLAENPGVACHHWAALTLWFLGYPDQALARIHQALDLAHDLAHSFSLAQASERAAMLHQLRREAGVVQELAEQTIAVAAQRGFLYWNGTGDIMRGWALAVQGQFDQGITQIRQGLETCQTTGATIEQPYFLALLADAYGHAGQISAGLDAITEALELVRNSRAFFFEAELHRLRGVLLLQTGLKENVPKAESSFQQAFDLAREQQAKSLELKATVSLGRLWLEQDKTEEARELVDNIYGWFTEGFDTADLQEARTLLEELGGEVKKQT